MLLASHWYTCFLIYPSSAGEVSDLKTKQKVIYFFLLYRHTSTAKHDILDDLLVKNN